MTVTRGVALSLAVMLATGATTVSRAAGTSTVSIPAAKLTTITSRGDARAATLVIEATEPVPYVATRPDPLTVFGMEHLLELPPGELSRHLGYRPVDSGESVVDAIEADPLLDDASRRILLGAYQQAVRD